MLPLPVPTTGQAARDEAVFVQIRGLKSGNYTLTENGKALVTAPAADWAKGIVLKKGISQTLSAQLSDSIAWKNELFFRQYRPLNRTYILGFREYEQGSHRSEKHTSELQSLMRLSYAVFCLKKKKYR